MSPGPDAEAPTPGTKAEPLRWDVDMEVQLFYAMAPYKPVGINKHFHMAAIWEKLSNSLAKDITTNDIWRHIDTLYDINMLDDTEPIPFSTEEIDFSLPEDEFGEYLKRKSLDVPTVDFTEDTPSPHSKSLQKGTPRSASKDSKPRKESLPTSKTRKESGSSHASTDTNTNKSDKEFGSGSRSDRRNSRDSNASGTIDSSSGRKSMSNKKTPKSRTGRPAAETSWSEENERGSRSRRRANTSTPPPTPAKRRRL